MCGLRGRPQTRSPRLFPRDRGLRSALVPVFRTLRAAIRSPSVTIRVRPVCSHLAERRCAAPFGRRLPRRYDALGATYGRLLCAPLQLPSAAQRFDEDCRRAPARPAINGGTVCGGRDGLRHAGPRGPGRPRLAARCGRLHDGRLSAGGGGVPRRGADGSGDGRRLARAARAAHRHDDRAAADVPAPGPLRGTAQPATAARSTPGTGWAGGCSPSWRAPRDLLLAHASHWLDGRHVPELDRALAGLPPVDADHAGAVPARLPRLSGQGLGAVGPAHRPADRRSDAGHRGGSVRRHGAGTPGDVRTGRAAAVVRADALPQRAAAAQGAALLAGARARGHRPLRRRAAPVPGGAPRRPGLHGHLGPARRHRRGRRVRRRRPTSRRSP